MSLIGEHDNRRMQAGGTRIPWEPVDAACMQQSRARNWSKEQLHAHTDQVISGSGGTPIIFSSTNRTLSFSLHPLE